MPRTADPTDIPERLLAAGHELFLRQGYHASGIQQITDQAGVPKGSFYNHFESKEAFAAAIVKRYEDFNRRSWERMVQNAPPSPLAAIHHVFEQMVGYHERTPCHMGCLVGNFAAEIALSSEACRQGLLSAQMAWRERLGGMIAAAQAAGEVRRDVEPTALSALTWSAWEGALLRMKVEQSAQPLRDTVDLMLTHMYPPRAATRAASRHPVSTSSTRSNT